MLGCGDVPFLGVPSLKICEVMGTIFIRLTELWVSVGYHFQKWCGIKGPVLHKVCQSIDVTRNAS